MRLYFALMASTERERREGGERGRKGEEKREKERGKGGEKGVSIILGHFGPFRSTGRELVEVYLYSENMYIRFNAVYCVCNLQ